MNSGDEGTAGCCECESFLCGGEDIAAYSETCAAFDYEMENNREQNSSWGIFQRVNACN